MTTLLSAGNTNNGRLARDGNSRLAVVPSAPPDTIFVCNAWKSTFIYTESGHWYGAGSNERKIFGTQGSSSSSYVPLPHFDFVQPKWAACSDDHIAIVSTSGELYCCGGRYSDTLKKIQLPEKFEFVACGESNMLAIPDGTGIYMFNSDGEPRKVSPELKFIDCAVGNRQFLALTDEYQLYTWGRGKQCGQGRKFSSSTPTLVDLTSLSLTRPICRVFAYHDCSFFLTFDSLVYATGRNGNGQCGLGSLSKTNHFMKVRTPEERISMLSCGSDNTYIITETGDVYACGDCSNCLLLASKDENARLFIKCDHITQPVTFASANTGHVNVAVGMQPLPHPLVKKISVRSRPYLKSFVFSGTTHLIDVSDEGLNCFGLAPNDVIVKKVSTEKKDSQKKPAPSKSDNQEMTVLGISRGTDLAVTVNGSPMLLESFDPRDTPLLFDIVNRPGKQLKKLTGRSGNCYQINVNETDSLAWGVYPGEIVSSPDFGEGIVEGTLGSGLWITWKQDKATSSISDIDPIDLFSVISILRPKDRSLSLFKLPDGREIPGEVMPCKILESYGFHVGDIVTISTSSSPYLGTIQGSFSHFALIKPYQGSYTSVFPNKKPISDDPHDIILESIFSLTPIRCTASSVVKKRAFGGSFCEVDLCPNSGDPLFPLDRILVSGKLGTVLGRDVKGTGFWINFDDAFLINEGAVFVTAQEAAAARVLARFDAPLTVDGLSVQETLSDDFICGDIVRSTDDQQLYVAIGRDGKKQMVYAQVGGEKKTTLNSPVLIRRGFGKGKGKTKSVVGLSLEVDVSIELFQGMGLGPGDEVITPKGNAVVAGMFAGDVWFFFKSQNASGFFPQQMIYSDLVTVTHRLTSDISFK